MILVLICQTGTLQASTQEGLTTIRWMSEQYPPYNFLNDQGEPKGIAVELLLALARKLDFDLAPEQIEFLPWARGYTILSKKSYTALFSMVRTPQREQQFRFVGPIIDSRVVLIAAINRALVVEGAEDINRLTIGVVRDDIGEQSLRSIGVKPEAIVVCNSAKQLVQLLNRGRVDAIAYELAVARWNFGQAGLGGEQFEEVFTLLEGGLWYAFHRDTPELLLETLQHGLDQLRAEGELQRIRARYPE
jgi:ABC-type amino acid transport substrate-binding protein